MTRTCQDCDHWQPVARTIYHKTGWGSCQLCKKINPAPANPHVVWVTLLLTDVDAEECPDFAQLDPRG